MGCTCHFRSCWIIRPKRFCRARRSLWRCPRFPRQCGPQQFGVSHGPLRDVTIVSLFVRPEPAESRLRAKSIFSSKNEPGESVSDMRVSFL
jgi:hypothetical protein